MIRIYFINWNLVGEWDEERSEYLSVSCHPYADVIEETESYCVLSDVCQMSQGHANLAVHEQAGLGMLSTILVIHRRTSSSPRRLIQAEAVAEKVCGSVRRMGSGVLNSRSSLMWQPAGSVNWSLGNLHATVQGSWFTLSCVLCWVVVAYKSWTDHHAGSQSTPLRHCGPELSPPAKTWLKNSQKGVGIA